MDSRTLELLIKMRMAWKELEEMEIPPQLAKYLPDDGPERPPPGAPGVRLPAPIEEPTVVYREIRATKS